MDDIWMRIASQLAARVSGPMKFRLVYSQPWRRSSRFARG